MAPDICTNATYEHRIDNPRAFNFCIVGSSGYDAVLFVAVALLIACLVVGRLSALNVLLVGAVVQTIAYYYNLGRLGNAISEWIAMDGKSFFYVFLPPLLLDSALRIDFYMFRKVLGLSLTFAFVIVTASTFLAIPILLCVLRLDQEGWTWIHAALFSAMVASTDAAAVSSNLKAGGAPELLAALLEGESLFNDGSGLVLFDIFLHKLIEQNSHKPHQGMGVDNSNASSAIDELFDVAREFSWLVGGGLTIGLWFGIAASQILKFLQWRRSQPYIEVTVTLGGAYLSYFIADAYLASSGVIAVVCFGLWGSANQSFGISIKAKREKWLSIFWETCTFGVNSVIFFFVGVSAMNYILRLGSQLEGPPGFEGGGKHSHEKLFRAMSITLPLIYIFMTLLRGGLIAIFAPMVNRISKGGIELSWKEIIFATMGGLRGGVSLILAQSVLMLESSSRYDTGSLSDSSSQRDVIAEMGLFTAGFVLLTLLVNGPLLTPLMTYLKLNASSAANDAIRVKARRALQDYTESVIRDLKVQGQESMRGVDWGQVKEYVNLDQDLERILPTKQIHHPYPSSPIISKTGLQPAEVARQIREEGENDIEQPLLASLGGLNTPLLPKSNKSITLGTRSGGSALTATEKGVAWLSHAAVGSSDPQPDIAPYSTSGPSDIARAPSFAKHLAYASRDRVDPLIPALGPRSEATGIGEDLDEQYDKLLMDDKSMSCFFRSKEVPDSPCEAEEEDKLLSLRIPSSSLRLSSARITAASVVGGRRPNDGCSPLSRSSSAVSPHPLVAGDLSVPLGPAFVSSGLEAVAESHEEHEHLEAQEKAMMSAFISELMEGSELKGSVDDSDQPGLEKASPRLLLGEDGPSWRSTSNSINPPVGLEKAGPRILLGEEFWRSTSDSFSPPRPLLPPTVSSPTRAAFAPLPPTVSSPTRAAAANRVMMNEASDHKQKKIKKKKVEVKKLDPVLTVTNRSLTYSSTTNKVTEDGEDKAVIESTGNSSLHLVPSNSTLLDSRLTSNSTLLCHPSLAGFGASSWEPVGRGLVRDNSLQPSYRKISSSHGQMKQGAMQGADGLLPEVVTYRLTAMGERVVASSSSFSHATRGITAGHHHHHGTAPIRRIIEEEHEAAEDEKEVDEKEASEYRMRLLSGLKRYFHLKHEEGLLSSQSLRTLSWCVDLESDQSESPLTLWTIVEGEVKGKGLVSLIGSIHFTLRIAVMFLRSAPKKGRKRVPGSLLVAKIVQWMAAMLARHLSRVMMVALEVALELWQSLTSSPQVEWLEYAGKTGAMLKAEVEEQAELCWRFIIDREIEAPDRFCAIQSHRAAMAVLRQQTTFVTQLYDAGAVDEHESEELVSPIERRMWRLEIKGPRWRQPSLSQVLSNVPFLQHLPPAAIDWFKSKGRLQRFKKGENIGTDLNGPQGMFVVINGMVRCELREENEEQRVGGGGEPDDGDEKNVETFYVGSGGVGGLTSALLGGHIAGTRSRHAFAEGNALGKGPVLFILGQDAIKEMRALARSHANRNEAMSDLTSNKEALGEAMVALELHMHRLAGLFLVDRNKQQIMATCSSTLLAAAHDAEAKAKSNEQQSTLEAGYWASGGVTRATASRRVSRLRLILDPAAEAETSLGGKLHRHRHHRHHQRRMGREDVMEVKRKREEMVERVFDGVVEGDVGEDREGKESSEDSSTTATGSIKTVSLSTVSGKGEALSHKPFPALEDEERLSRACLEQSLMIYDQVKLGLKSAELLVLERGQVIDGSRRGALVLMQGSLIQTRSKPAARSKLTILPIYKPPSVLLCLPHLMEDKFQSSGSVFQSQGAGVRYIAGPMGATVLASEEVEGVMGDEDLGHITEEERDGEEGEGEEEGGPKATPSASSRAMAMLTMPSFKRSPTIRFQQHS